MFHCSNGFVFHGGPPAQAIRSTVSTSSAINPACASFQPLRWGILCPVFMLFLLRVARISRRISQWQGGERGWHHCQFDSTPYCYQIQPERAIETLNGARRSIAPDSWFVRSDTRVSGALRSNCASSARRQVQWPEIECQKATAACPESATARAGRKVACP